jgi:general secretion pathway protein H
MGIIVTLRAGTDDRGFSLIELVLVLVLLGVSSLIVIPNVNRGMRAQQLRKTAREFAAVARNLRSRALDSGIPQQLVIDAEENRYLPGRRGEVRLPPSVRFAAIEGGEALDRRSRRFLFFPNGSALPGRVEFSLGKASSGYSIRFEPLTGRVEVLKAESS